jgi:23S rRNA (cytosine1962-C5)-methyltransferase
MVFMSDASEKLRVALLNRQSIIETAGDQTNVYRIVNSSADGFEGVTVDRLGNVLLMEQHRKDADMAGLMDALASAWPETPIFLKKRCSSQSSDRCGIQIAGPQSPSVFEVMENGLRFVVRLLDDEHIGLFVDSRLPREWVRANSENRRVLNLFSYTGGFGLAAAAGGARSTVNIDNKNSALHFARENYRRNGLPADNRTFFRCDALYYLKRAAGQQGRFDLIVVDPPPRFKRRRQRDFLAHEDYGRLLAMCVAVLDDGGVILAGLNALKASDARLDEMIDQAATACGVCMEVTAELGAHEDFPPTPDRPTSRFRVLRVVK